MTALSGYHQSNAQQQTRAAQQQLDALLHVLTDSLGIGDKFDWDELKDRSQFPNPKPNKPVKGQPPRRRAPAHLFSKAVNSIRLGHPPSSQEKGAAMRSRFRKRSWIVGGMGKRN